MFEGERKKLILLIFSSREDIDSCCYAKVLYSASNYSIWSLWLQVFLYGIAMVIM